MCNSSYQCVCPGGTANCNGTCVDLTTDKNNCGVCNNYCSTTCSGGECLVSLASNTPCGSSGSGAIAINGIKAYIAGNSNIYAVSLSGGGAVGLANNYPQNSPTGIAIDGSYVYWTNFQTGTVMRVDLNGSTAPLQLSSGQTYPSAMAIDGTYLYWVNYNSPGAVMKMLLSSQAVSSLASGINGPAGIAVDSAYAYVGLASDDYVISVQLSNGSIAQLTTFQNNPSAIAIDSSNVYFTNDAINGDAHQVAKNANKSAGVSLGPSASPPGGIATDGTNVYWVGNDNVYKCPVGAVGGCKVFVPNQTRAAYVAVDSTSVYWTDCPGTTGSLMSITPK
jgi:hypothetical protein